MNKVLSKNNWVNAAACFGLGVACWITGALANLTVIGMLCGIPLVALGVVLVIAGAAFAVMAAINKGGSGG